MSLDAPTPPAQPPELACDEILFGWHATPAIVSVWAGRQGRALVALCRATGRSGKAYYCSWQLIQSG
jgi:hypothetical protein